MRAQLILTVTIIGLCVSGSVFALERDSRAIDSATASYRSYDKWETTRCTVRGEFSVYERTDWAIVTELGAGRISHNDVGHPNLWFVSGGMRYVLTSKDSLSLLAIFEWADSGKEYRTDGGKLVFDHRFISADESLSPFVSVGAALQDVRARSSWAGSEGNFTAWAIRLTIGCDILLREDAALVIQASRDDSWDISNPTDGHYANGWSGAVALKYYWR